jgi:hypothetical protein
MGHFLEDSAAIILTILAISIATLTVPIIHCAFTLLLMGRATRRFRITLFESNYGREAGWIVEREGIPVAILRDVQFEEMFWDSYQIKPLVKDPDEAKRILTDPKWWIGSKLTYRNREFGIINDWAFPSLSVFTPTGRIVMRGLYFGVDRPNCLEEVILWFRMKFGKNTIFGNDIPPTENV